MANRLFIEINPTLSPNDLRPDGASTKIAAAFVGWVIDETDHIVFNSDPNNDQAVYGGFVDIEQNDSHGSIRQKVLADITAYFFQHGVFWSSVFYFDDRGLL